MEDIFLKGFKRGYHLLLIKFENSLVEKSSKVPRKSHRRFRCEIESFERQNLSINLTRLNPSDSVAKKLLFMF